MGCQEGGTLIIAGQFSFKDGKEVVNAQFPDLLTEVEAIIQRVDSSKHKRKRSKEKTMRGQLLYSPISINKAFKREFLKRSWSPIRVPCDYSTAHYSEGYDNKRLRAGAFREMDFVKRSLGVEVQFGKYAFMVYNVCAKMTIFRNLGHIRFGIEIVPVKAFADEMSSGVSYFEQFIWDLETRGVADIDVPVLILGIDA
jgi:hypothetical protein